MEKAIGFGRYSKIYKGQDKRGDCKTVAIKVINRDIISDKTESPYEELSILQKLDHESIIKLLDYIDSSRHLILIFELAERGDLFQMLKERGPISESQTASVINDIGSALFYLHNDSIIHRNVKLENILVFRVTHYHIHTKLADFSLAIKIYGSISTVCGSINYISPEMAERKEYSYPIDIWALGVVCYILLSALPPFYSVRGEKEEILDQIRNCDYTFPLRFWSNISQECKELIESLLHHDPDKRLSSLDLLCTRWVVYNGDIKEFDKQGTTDKINIRRSELYHKMTGINYEKKLTDSKNERFLDCVKSFFKGSTVQNEPIKPIFEPNYLRFHKRNIKFQSNETDPSILFD